MSLYRSAISCQRPDELVETDYSSTLCNLLRDLYSFLFSISNSNRLFLASLNKLLFDMLAMKIQSKIFYAGILHNKLLAYQTDQQYNH
jgi:hypothetical protein